MHLIEYAEGSFVNTEKIELLSITEYGVRFIIGSSTNYESVSKEFRSSFVNHLQAINTNTTNIENCYFRTLAKKPDKEYPLDTSTFVPLA
jgi:hypothetical protein